MKILSAENLSEAAERFWHASNSGRGRLVPCFLKSILVGTAALDPQWRPCECEFGRVMSGATQLQAQVLSCGQHNLLRFLVWC